MTFGGMKVEIKNKNENEFTKRMTFFHIVCYLHGL